MHIDCILDLQHNPSADQQHKGDRCPCVRGVLHALCACSMHREVDGANGKTKAFRQVRSTAPMSRPRGREQLRDFRDGTSDWTRPEALPAEGYQIRARLSGVSDTGGLQTGKVNIDVLETIPPLHSVYGLHDAGPHVLHLLRILRPHPYHQVSDRDMNNSASGVGAAHKLQAVPATPEKRGGINGVQDWKVLSESSDTSKGYCRGATFLPYCVSP